MIIYLSTGDITATNIYKSLPTRWRRKPAGTDVERNYVTVASVLCRAVQRIHRMTVT